MAIVLLIIPAEMGLIVLGLLAWVYFVAGGNWLKEEEQYVKWRHYAGVKLHIIKPNWKKHRKPRRK